MTGLGSAIGFLTILPVGSRDPTGLAASRMWFPIVGLLLGIVLSGLDLLMHWGYPLFRDEPYLFPSFLGAVILVVVLIILTRALHLDGFMDSCDGLLGSFDRERRLEIMRDSHVGAFAVTGVAGLLLVKAAALLSLPSVGRMWVLLLFPCLSRWAMQLVLQVFPYVRSRGIATPFLERSGWWQLAAGLVVTLAATLTLTGPFGLVLWGGATATGWGVGSWAAKQLGGTTGDVYGAVNEVVEAVVLALAAVLAHGLSDSLFAPLHEWAW